MNHQPFEDWLLEDEPLSVQQVRELQLHLRVCPKCAAIANSNLALHSRQLAAPRPGFTDRFRPRLAAWRREQTRRQALGTIVLVVAGLVLLYSLAGPAMLQAVQNPTAWLSEVAGYVVTTVTLISVVGQVSRILLRDLPGLLAPVAWLGLLFAGCILGVLWTSVVRRLAKVPRGV